ncbi:MAG: peroxiredoxin-like family protein [Hyphomicrobium sp.]
MSKPTSLVEAFDQICEMDGSLGDKLAAYNSRLKELNFPFAEAYDDLVSRLIDGQIGATAPKPGDRMPTFLLPGPDARLVSLEDVLAHGPAVLSFNRGHWCPFCRIELRALSDHHEELQALGVTAVSIIPDRQAFAARLDQELGERILILSDIDNAYSLSIGLALWLGDRLHELMLGRGHHLETYQGSDGWFVPLPATFVVSRKGIVVASFVDPDFRKRMEPDAILEILREL